MGLTHFPNGVSSFGVPQIGGSVWPVGGGNNSPGRAYWVDPTNGSDSNNGSSPDKALAKLSRAHTMMTANQNDTAFVIGNSSASSATVVSETATLTWSKNLCHIVGVNAFNRISHRVSIRPVTNQFTPLVSVTASGCVFADFHVFTDSSSTSAITWAETGQRNAHINLHIGNTSNQTQADAAGSRAMTISGDGERYFERCTFGIDTGERAGANATVESLNIANRDMFVDCMFIMRSDAAAPFHYMATTSSAIDRFVYFKSCLFTNFSTGTAQVAALDIDGSLGGHVILHDCQLVGATNWEGTASGNVFVEAAQAAGTSGIMVAHTT